MSFRFRKILLALFILLNLLNYSFAADPVSAYRTITFVNQCPFPIWFGLSGGSAVNSHPSHPGDTRCQSDADCSTGSICIPTGDIKQCFWKNPIPQNGHFELAAKTGTNKVQIPIYQNNQNIIWSGAIAGRTNCSGGVCETADCEGGVGSCKPTKGFLQPATQAEFTFSKNTPDYYDVEIINGFNLPIKMTPIPEGCLDGNCSNPYHCGSPGGNITSTSINRCNWTFNVPSNDYKWVAKGGVSCTADNACKTSEVCGLSYDPTRKPMLQKTCGKLLGYWSAGEICGKDKNYGIPVNCSQNLPAPQDKLTLWNLYACVGVGSCYQPGAQNNCCGCVDWDKIGIDVPPAPFTQLCNNINPNWRSGVLDKLAWLKKACPTAYTYPYDDMSSTFTCKRMQNGVNQVNYTIVYCPDGRTGGVTG